MRGDFATDVGGSCFLLDTTSEKSLTGLGGEFQTDVEHEGASWGGGILPVLFDRIEPIWVDLSPRV